MPVPAKLARCQRSFGAWTTLPSVPWMSGSPDEEVELALDAARLGDAHRELSLKSADYTRRDAGGCEHFSS